MASTNGYPAAPAAFPNVFNSIPGALPPTLPVVSPYASSTNAAARPVWTEHVTQDGRKYFFNHQTRQSSWEKPEDLKSEAEKILSRCPWREYRAQNGKVYYSHIHTKKSVWTKPPEMLEAERQAQVASQNSHNSVASPLAIPAPGTPGNSNSSLPGSPVRTQPSAIEEAMEKTLESLDIEAPAALKSASESEDSDSSSDQKKSKKPAVVKVEPRTQQDKEECFKDILRLKKVPSTASWETAVRLIQDDPRYPIIKHMKNRKQIFNIYKTQRQKEEKEEQRLRYKKTKEELEHFLLNTSRISSTVRYRKADTMFADLKVWTSVPDHDRRDIFHDVVKEIEKRERDDARSLQKRNIESFSQILDSMKDLTSMTSWQDLQMLLCENERFKQDEELLNMDKEDALICFQNHICKLEKEEDDKKEEERMRLKRQHRKNREAFLVFLDELRDRNKITSISLWKECYPDICDDNRFEQMLLQPGSTPLDLFKFYVDDLKKRYPDDKRIVKEIMKDRAFIIDADTSYEEFFSLINADERGRTLDAGNIRLSFDSLQEKALCMDEEKKAEEKKARLRYAEEFKLLLQTAEPPISAVNTSWDDVVEKFGHEESFQGLGLESERLQVFKEFLKEQTVASTKKKKKKEKKKKKGKDKKKSDAESEQEDLDKDRKRKRKRKKDDGGDSGSEHSSNKKLKKKKKHKKSKKRKNKEKQGSESGASEGEISEGEESPPAKKARKKSKKDLTPPRASGESELSENELELRRQTLLAQLDR